MVIQSSRAERSRRKEKGFDGRNGIWRAAIPISEQLRWPGSMLNADSFFYRVGSLSI
jgi:hypothetical protein